MSSVPTVAEQLRAAREARHLTIPQLADITKLKSDHIRALEEGNYSAFAAPVYVRGFLRTLGNLFKLDVPALLKAVDEEMARSGKFAEKSFNRLPPKGPLDDVMLLLSRVNWRISLVLIGVVAAVGIVLFTYRAWREQRTRDPLSGIAPGMHQPRSGGETLPLPAPAPAKK